MDSDPYAMPIAPITPPRKNKNTLIWVLAAIIILAGVGVGCLLAFGKSPKTNQNNDTSAEENPPAVLKGVPMILTDNFLDALDQVYAPAFIVNIRDALETYLSQFYPDGTVLDCSYNRTDENGNLEWRITTTEGDVHIMSVVISGVKVSITLNDEYTVDYSNPPHNDEYAGEEPD